MTFIAAMLLAVAGLFLTVAWQAGPQVALRKFEYASYTSRADVPIVESWLALEIDLPTIRSPEHWRASTLASPCIVVGLPAEWGGESRRAFCGNRFGFNESYEVAFLDAIAPNVSFAWTRDERGFAVPEIRLTRAAREWLASHAPDTFMHRDWPAKTALDWLRLQLDRPVDAAIAGWSAPPAVLSIAFDPKRPDAVLPSGIVDARNAREAMWALPLAIGAVGGLLWFAGMAILPAMNNFNRVGRVVMTLLPLAALPWFADHFPGALRAFSAPLSQVFGDMFRTLDPLDRIVVSDRDGALLASGERLTWRAGDGAYSDTFGRFRFSPPASPASSPDAALAALAASVTAQIRALDDDQRARLYASFRRDKLLDLVRAGIVALPAARDALLDPATDPRTAAAARGFLSEWVTQPIEPLDPRQPAYRTRLEMTEALADVPVPEIANLAKRSR